MEILKIYRQQIVCKQLVLNDFDSFFIKYVQNNEGISLHST